MSVPGFDTVDVDALARGDAGVERSYPLARFVRLADLLAGAQGEAHATLAFGRLAEGQAGCKLDVSAVVTVLCQRCLEPFELAVHHTTKLAFVAREEDAGSVPEGFDAVAAEHGMVDLAALVEDELLLSLPVVALHGAGTPCGGAARQAEDDARAAPDAGTHRPFAKLQDLLKH